MEGQGLGLRFPRLTRRTWESGCATPSGQGHSQQDLGSEAEAAAGLHDLLQHVALDARRAHVLVHNAVLQMHVVHCQADQRAVLVLARLGAQGHQREGWKPEGQVTPRKGHHPTPSQPPDPAPRTADVRQTGTLKSVLQLSSLLPAHCRSLLILKDFPFRNQALSLIHSLWGSEKDSFAIHTLPQRQSLAIQHV